LLCGHVPGDEAVVFEPLSILPGTTRQEIDIP